MQDLSTVRGELIDAIVSDDIACLLCKDQGVSTAHIYRGKLGSDRKGYSFPAKAIRPSGVDVTVLLDDGVYMISSAAEGGVIEDSRACPRIVPDDNGFVCYYDTRTVLICSSGVLTVPFPVDWAASNDATLFRVAGVMVRYLNGTAREMSTGRTVRIITGSALLFDEEVRVGSLTFSMPAKWYRSGVKSSSIVRETLILEVEGITVPVRHEDQVIFRGTQSILINDAIIYWNGIEMATMEVSESRSDTRATFVPKREYVPLAERKTESRRAIDESPVNQYIKGSAVPVIQRRFQTEEVRPVQHEPIPRRTAPVHSFLTDPVAIRSSKILPDRHQNEQHVEIPFSTALGYKDFYREQTRIIEQVRPDMEYAERTRTANSMWRSKNPDN